MSEMATLPDPRSAATELPSPSTPGGPTRRGGDIAAMALWAVVIAAVVLLFAVPTPEIKGALTIALSVVLILLGLHVGLALLLAGLGGIVALAGLNAGMVSLAETPFNTSASWSLTVIPLFVLMGTALSRFGLMDRLFKVAQAWLAWLPGGLGVATNFAGAGLAATSGSSIGISYTLADRKSVV